MANKLPEKTGFVSSINNETTLIDGLRVSELISNYAGVSFVANRSGFIDTAAKLSGGPYKNQLINDTIYEMPFIQWSGLVDFVLNNLASKDSAKYLINTLVVGDAIKEELAYSSTGIKNVVDYAYGYKFAPNINSIFTEGLNNKVIDGDGSNSFNLSMGKAMSGITVWVGIKDIDFVEVGSGSGVTDSSGDVTIPVVLSSFSEGFVYIKSAELWSKTAYSSTLNANINIAQLINFNSYNYIGTSAVIAAKKNTIVSGRSSAVSTANNLLSAD